MNAIGMVWDGTFDAQWQSNCVMTPERIQKPERIGVVWDAAE